MQEKVPASAVLKPLSWALSLVPVGHWPHGLGWAGPPGASPKDSAHCLRMGTPGGQQWDGRSTQEVWEGRAGCVPTRYRLALLAQHCPSLTQECMFPRPWRHV